MILHSAPDQIACALLFDADPETIDVDALLAHANTLIRAPGQSFQRASLGAGAGAGLFAGHGLFVHVCLNHRPLGMEGFTHVLASPYTALTLEGAQTLVARHRASIVVTVSSRPPASGDGLEATAGADGGQTRESFELKLMLCRQIAGFIARQGQPAVVHWRQSDILISGAHFLGIADENEMTLLHVHPYLFSTGVAADGKPLLGASLHGAKMLINTEVLFAPAPAPAEYITTRLVEFVDMVRQRDGALPPDGDSFGAETGERVRIRHVAARGDAPAHVELTLEQSDVLGIDALTSDDAGARTSKEKATPVPVADPKAVIAAEIPEPVEAAHAVAALASAPVVASEPKAAPAPVAAPVQESLPVAAPVKPAVRSVEIPVLRPEAQPVAARQKITRANAPQARIPDAAQAGQGLLGRLRALLG